MDAVKFLKTCKRICDRTGGGCENCFIVNNCPAYRCDYEIDEGELVEIVEAWAKKHPMKTRQQLFLEQYPNASMQDGTIVICPIHMDDVTKCTFEMPCLECRRKYWNEEVEE